MSFLKKCPVCNADAAEVTPFFRVTLPLYLSGDGYRVRCRRCGHKAGYSKTRLGAIQLWNSKLHKG